MRRAFAVAVVLALFLGLEPQANAHLRAHRDPEDASGRDLRRVVLSRTGDGRFIEANLGLHDGRRRYASYRFDFDSRGDAGVDYYAIVRWDGASGGIWSAVLYRADGRETTARVHVNGGWFPIWFGRWRLHPGKHIRWRVEASNLNYQVDGPIDAAPDFGWYRH